MHRARKRFGQHFLHDPGVIGRIVAAIEPQPDDRIVEIGPGLGALTVPLLTRVRELHAIEIDRDAIHHLRSLTADAPALHIHYADVLNFDVASLRDARRLRIVGNLPYNISTPLLFRLIEQRDAVLDMHFMLQKEVVDRMAARAGGEHYGRLTVMLAPWLRIEPLFDIGPGAFRPPPQVVSTFVRLKPLAQPLRIDRSAPVRGSGRRGLFQRRKTLRNALKPLLNQAEIAAAGIDPGVRGEVIAASGFAALAAQLALKSADGSLPTAGY